MELARSLCRLRGYEQWRAVGLGRAARGEGATSKGHAMVGRGGRPDSVPQVLQSDQRGLGERFSIQFWSCICACISHDIALTVSLRAASVLGMREYRSRGLL